MSDINFEDDVKEEKVNQPPAEQQNAVAKKEQIKTTVTLSDEAKKSLESTGVIVGNLGEKVSRVPIEKYKASTQRTDRIGIISTQFIGVKFHYGDDVGSIVCFGKECCKMLGTPQVRYLFPIVVYSTDPEGTIVDKKITLRVLSAGEDLYKSICTLHRGASDFGGLDFIDAYVTCTDDKYQKITLQSAGKAAWRSSAKLYEMITSRWAEDSESAYMAIARKVDSASFAKLVGLDDVGGPAPAGSSGGSFDASKNKDLSSFFDE